MADTICPREYQIVMASTSSEMQAKITQLTKEGWCLHGPLMFAPTGAFCREMIRMR